MVSTVLIGNWEMEMSKFVVYNDSAIYGLGDSEQSAWTDCNEWAGDAYQQAVQDMGEEAPTTEAWLKKNFRCAPATDALVEMVKGGKVDAFGHLPDGRACTFAELDAA